MMLGRFKLAYRLITINRHNVLNGFIAFCVLLILLGVMLHINGLYRFFDTASQGFVPNFILRTQSNFSESEQAQIHRDLIKHGKNAAVVFGTAHFVSGARFEVEDRSTPPTSVLFLGLNFEGDAQLQIHQAGRVFDTTLTAFSGGDFLEVASQPGLIAGLCSIETPRGSLPMLALPQAEYTRLFVDDEIEGSVLAFRTFLYELVSRFVPPNRSGVSWDRFAVGENGTTQAHDVFRRRYTNAYATLLFQHTGKLRALCSEQLFNQLNPYQSITDTRCFLKEQTVPLRVLDSFHFPVSDMLPPKTVLLNHRQMKAIAGVDLAYNIAFVYADSLNVPALKQTLADAGQSATLHTREQFFANDRSDLVQRSIMGMCGLFWMVVLLNLGGRLIHYYKTQGQALALLRHYGFRGAPFLTASFAALILAIPAAVGVLGMLRMQVDQLFEYYEFPPLFPSAQAVWVPALLACLLLLALWGGERILIHNQRHHKEEK